MAESEPQAAGEGLTATTTEASLLDDILSETKLVPTDEGYDVTRTGIKALLKELMSPKHQNEKVDKAFFADALIAEIDEKITKQVDVILHHPDFQKIESAWRGLKFVVEHTDFRENIKIELLNVSKADLMTDFEDAPEITKSGLYRIAYTAEYGTFGGKPYGAIFSNYDFGPGPQDVQLLQNCAAVSAMAHAPFFAAAGPTFFGDKDFLKLPNLRDLRAIFEGPQYTKWQSFRSSEDARYVGLCMPRFLLRLPYGNKTVPAKNFSYEEDVVGRHERYSWGSATFAMASRIADSFAKYRWCPNIIGPQAGGSVEDLPLHQYEAMGEIQTKCPTEVQISERREFTSCPRRASSALTFPQGRGQRVLLLGQQLPEAEDVRPVGRGQGRGAQLPPGHAAAVHVRHLPHGPLHQSPAARADRFVEGAQRPAARAQQLDRPVRRRPGRRERRHPRSSSAPPRRRCPRSVRTSRATPAGTRWTMKVRPHFKYMGAFFTLSLVGKLDKE